MEGTIIPSPYREGNMSHVPEMGERSLYLGKEIERTEFNYV